MSEVEQVRVAVWDLPTRVFHWTLVALFIFLVVTGFRGGDALTWHMNAAHALIALLFFRLAWGFVGGTHARFSSFALHPAAAMRYAKRLLSREPAPTLGHDPLAAWNVLALLALLTVQVLSGLASSDDIMSEGPLVALVAEDSVDAATSVHHANSRLLFAFVGMHLGGVLFHLLVKRQNLVSAMFTGHRVLPRALAHEGRRASNGLALLLFLLAVALVYGVARLLEKLS